MFLKALVDHFHVQKEEDIALLAGISISLLEEKITVEDKNYATLAIIDEVCTKAAFDKWSFMEQRCDSRITMLCRHIGYDKGIQSFRSEAMEIIKSGIF